MSAATEVTANAAAARHAPPPRVSAKGLNYVFDINTAPKQVLFDVDFTLAPGELVVLTGPSGAGKTTLLSLIGALRTAQSGRLEVFGRDLVDLDAEGQREVRRQTGFIFQDHHLFEALTVRQTLELAMRLAGEKQTRESGQARAREMLRTLGIEEYLERKPRSLSGGQKQRVAIARALINDPALVLADEPTAALDSENVTLVVDLLRRRTAEVGASVIVVTHDSRTFAAADRIVNMVDGRIVS